jgi:hypothetical protein
VTDGGSFGVRVLFTTSARFLHGTLTNTRLSTIDAPGTVLDRVKANSSPIDFDESNTSRLTHSVLRESPVELFEDNKVLVADNTLDRSPIVVSGNSVAETFRHNTITNADVGINYFDDVRHSQFVDNTFRSNGIGLRIRTQGLLFLDGVAVSANRFVGNRAAGALIDARDVLGLPVTAAVRGNRFTGNGHAPAGSPTTSATRSPTACTSRYRPAGRCSSAATVPSPTVATASSRYRGPWSTPVGTRAPGTP